MRILLAEDDQMIGAAVRDALVQDGYVTDWLRDGQRADAALAAGQYDLVLLDLGLPGMDGVEVCRQLRTFSDCYVLMLTARADEVDKLIGLSVGADDYMTKPFSPRELVARIQVLLRRPRAGGAGTTASVLRIGALTVDQSSRRVELDASPVELTRTEFDLLQALAEHPGRVLNRRQLTDAVWGEDWVGDDHLVDVHIAHLRKKLGDDPSQPRFVQTVRGVGYRMGRGQ